MNKPFFTPREKLSEFLEIKELKLHKWIDPDEPPERPLEEREIEYPNIHDNIQLYNILIKEESFSVLFKPLDFFNLLYKELEIILNNNTEDCIEYLESINIERHKRSILFYGLSFIIYGLNDFDEPRDRKVWSDFISRKIKYIPGRAKSSHLQFINLYVDKLYKDLSNILSIGIFSPLDKRYGKLNTTSFIFLSDQNKHKTSTDSKSNYEKVLSHKQIALINFYNGKQITRENALEVIKMYGYNSKNSGESLYQDYSYFTSRTNRTESPGTKKKLLHKIDLFESIIKYINGNAQDDIISEIKILKTRLSEER